MCSYRECKNPAQYDGTTCFSEYMVQFDLVANYNGWGMHRRAMELATSLRGPAIAILSDLTPGERTNYQCLVKALTVQFDPDNVPEVCRIQLKHRVRMLNEPLAGRPML